MNKVLFATFQVQGQQQVVAQVAGQQKVLPNMLAAVLAKFFGVGGLMQQTLHPVGGAVNSASQYAGVFVGYLQRYAEE